MDAAAQLGRNLGVWGLLVLVALIATVGLLIAVVFCLLQISNRLESLLDTVVDIYDDVLETNETHPEQRHKAQRKPSRQ